MKYPILYAKDATDFFSLGLGVLTNTLEAKVTEERNGSFFLEAKVLTDTEMYKKIELDSLIKADAGASLKDQRFRVKRVIENHDGTADIYAEHISYLTQELSLQPRVLLKGNGTGALNQWANAIIDKHPFVTSSTVKTESQTSLEIGDVDNAREALGGVQGSILDKWGGEYLFDNYHISLKEKRGKTANTLIAYGRNITDFEQEKNIMSTYTSLFPYARYTDDDQNEHLVTLPEYLVDSEYVKSYPNRKALPVDFSSEFEGKNKPTPDKLRTLAERYIKDNEVGIPKVSIQVSFLDLSKTLDYKEMATLEELNLCDDVRVEYPKLGVSTISKVVKIVWDVLADRYDTIEIGAKRTTLGTTIKEQNDTIKEIEKNSNNAQLSADGKNMIFYGLYGENGLGEPTATKVGDLWYKPNGDYTIMYVWNGTIWEQVLNTEDEAIIKDELEQMDKEVQEAKDKADEVATGLDVIKVDVDKAIEDSQKAKDDAIKALEENEETKVEAQKAKEQSDQAIKDATSSMVTAKDALSKATENETSIGGLQVDIDKTNNELKTKANQSDLNTLKGTVTNQQTQITQNATDIKTKAEKTYVDTINNKVDKQQTQINQNSESIKLKAEKQEVTNLKNELDNLDIKERNLYRQTDFSNYDIPSSWWGIYKGTDFDGEIKSTENGVFLSARSGFGGIYTSNQNSPNIDGIEVVETIWIKGKGIVMFGQSSNYTEKFDIDTESFIPFSIKYKGRGANQHYIYAYASEVGTELVVKYAKLTFGNRTTDWSPAPEDLATADQVKDISASLEVQAGKIEMKADQVVVDNLKNTVNKQGTTITQNSEAIKLKAEKSQVDGLTGKVDKQQTEINQNAEQIKLKANQSTVNDIDKKVTNQQAQINLNSENIKLKAEKSEVTNLKNELDGLEFGGTNLSFDTNYSKKPEAWSGSSATIVKGHPNNYVKVERIESIGVVGVIQDGNHHFKHDEIYTLSFEIRTDNLKSLGYCYVISPQGNVRLDEMVEKIEVMKDNEWHKYTYTFKSWFNREKGRILIGGSESKSFDLRRLKLEKGTKPTDWSPAPEDLATQSDVTKIEASINVEAGKITNLTSSVNKNSTEIGKLTIESNKISSQVVELQNQEIGTQNLLDKSGWHTSSGVKMEFLDDKGYEIKASGGKGTGWPRLHNRSVKNIEWGIGSFYTLSFYIKTDKPNMVDLSAQIAYGDSTNKIMGTGSFKGKTEYEYHTYTFKYTKKVEMNDLTLQFFLYNTSPSPEDRTIWVKGVKLEKGQKATDWNLSLNDTATQSQITQLSDDILLRVQKGDVINQINVSTEGVLIQGKKIHITGQTKIDNAVIKDAMIASMTANKLTAGAINANEIAVINIKADNIVSGTLNGIYINLDKTLTIATNGSIVSSYLYGEPYGKTFNARWFDGTSRYGNRYMNFLSNVYDVNSNNTQGKFRHYTETFFGSDILKMRQYTNSSNTSTPISHLDVTANALFAGAGWKNDFVFDFPNGNMFLTGKITTYSLDSTWGLFTHGLTVATGGGKALQTGRIDAPDGYSTLLINSYRTDMAGLGLTKDRFYSEAIYNKTYSSGPQVCVTSAGTLGRVTSAAKYKLDIETPDNVINNAFKMLEIEPKMWFDKHEVETIAEAMSDGNLNDLEMEHQLRRHYGFIADDFHDKGLTEVVTYDEKGEIEGLQYDRISMYHNVILKRQQDEIETLKRQVAKLIGGGKHE